MERRLGRKGSAGNGPASRIWKGEIEPAAETCRLFYSFLFYPLQTESAVPGHEMLLDSFQRPLNDLRISVTDRCNYRCAYCMPRDEYTWLEREEILTFDEMARLARIFLSLGVEKIRLTGGEPLVRRDLEVLVRKLSGLTGLEELCLTTNGLWLVEKAGPLRAAGLNRLNVSLDTLDPEKFKKITKRGELEPVLKGIEEAKRHEFDSIKINAVVERGVNEDDILPLVEYGRRNRLSVRFIEYMDVGNANDWHSDRVVPKSEILETIHRRYPLRGWGPTFGRAMGPARRRANGNAPSQDYEFMDDGGEVGIIASVTEPFCATCSRVRLTADGRFVTCLFSKDGMDLKGPLRAGASDDEIAQRISSVWRKREDRYSEQRLEALHSIQGYRPKDHPKIEMIQLGG